MCIMCYEVYEVMASLYTPQLHLVNRFYEVFCENEVIFDGENHIAQ